MPNFVCPSCCGNAFGTKTALKNHLRILAENLYCTQCRKKFDTIRGLIDHLESFCTVHVETKTKYVTAFKENNRANDGLGLGAEFPVVTENLGAPSEDADSIPTVDATEIDATTGVDPATLLSCSSCKINLESVVDHIRNNHPNETVCYEDTAENIEGVPLSCREETYYNTTDHPYYILSTEETKSFPVADFHAITMRDESMAGKQSSEMCCEMINPERLSYVGSANENSLMYAVQISTQQSSSTTLMPATSSKNELFDNHTPHLLPSVDLCPESVASPKVSTHNGSTASGETFSPTTEAVTKRSYIIERLLPNQEPAGSVNLSTAEQTGLNTTPRDKTSYITEIQPTYKPRTSRIDIKTLPTDQKMVHVGPFWAGDLSEPAYGTKQIILPKSNKLKPDQVKLYKQVKLIPIENQDSGLDLTYLEGSSVDVENGIVGEFRRSKPGNKSIRKTQDFIVKYLADPHFPSPGEEIMMTKYFCSKCFEDFPEEQTFKLHKCSTATNPQRTCPVCDQNCATSRGFTWHLRKHDPTYRLGDKLKKKPREFTRTFTEGAAGGEIVTCTYTCKTCSQEFQEEDKFKKHHCTFPCPQACPICGITLKNNRHSTIHQRLHDLKRTPRELLKNSSDKFWECRVCNANIPTQIGLRVHMRMHRSVDEKKAEEAQRKAKKSNGGTDWTDENDYFTCAKCGERLLTDRKEMHEKMHRGDLLFCCTYIRCNRYFPSQEKLDFHLRYLHVEREVEGIFDCGMCTKKFVDRAERQEHFKKHYNKERPYQCTHCGHGFSKPSERVKHEWVHTGEQPHVCTTCGMKFRKHFNLVAHERIHSGYRPYACETCGKTFRTKCCYAQHLATHSEVRLHGCKLCPKRFKTRVQLYAHGQTHTKAFTCSLCSRRFSSISVMRRHVEGHSKPGTRLKHNCHVCGALYGQANALRDHLLTHGSYPPPAISKPLSDHSDSDSE